MGSVVFPQASQPSMNFNISELAYFKLVHPPGDEELTNAPRLAGKTFCDKFPSAGTDKVPDKCQGGRGVGVDTLRIN